jgi:hypothetical protein
MQLGVGSIKTGEDYFDGARLVPALDNLSQRGKRHGGKSLIGCHYAWFRTRTVVVEPA